MKTQVAAACADILGRLPAPFDVAAVAAKYPLAYGESMHTCLQQEVLRYNTLSTLMTSTLKALSAAIAGEIVFSADLEDLSLAVYDGKVPAAWLRRSFPTVKGLAGYVDDVCKRLAFLQGWIDNGQPKVFWLGGFSFTQSFLTAVLQNYARKHGVEIDTLAWQFAPVPPHAAANLPPPGDGAYVDGLYLEGAGWDAAAGTLGEPPAGRLVSPFPILHLQPTADAATVAGGAEYDAEGMYECPLYKTSERRGVLLTTGHSTNFVMEVSLRAGRHPPVHWVKRGTALLCQPDY